MRLRREEPERDPASFFPSVEEMRSFMARLGLPGNPGREGRLPAERSSPLPRREPFAGAPSASAGRRGTALVSICTRNYLHFARTLVASVRRHHPEIDLFVCVTDLAPGEEADSGGAVVLPAAALGIDRFPFLALKFSAMELCAALKPHALGHVMRSHGHRKILYLDSDLLLFAPLTALLQRLEDHPFVVTPHLLAPYPYPERFEESPTLGDVAYAGVMNSGLFGFRADGPAAEFIPLWAAMNTAPGARLKTLGGQGEQNFFNWATAFVEGAHVLRDPAYNVSYWNLHDRSLRCRETEGGEPEWTIDGRPLVTYHFSGFQPSDPCRVSRHDGRYSLYHLPALGRLFERYARLVGENGRGACVRIPYRYDRFPSGIPLDARMRDVIKEHETIYYREVDPWTAEGERWYCEALLGPVPSTGSLVPALFRGIYRERLDLRTHYPGADLEPAGLFDWIARHGIREYGYEDLFHRHRPTLPSRSHLGALYRLGGNDPGLLRGLARPMTDDFDEFASRVAAHNAALGETQRSCSSEIYRLGPVRTLREVVRSRRDIRRVFPDLLEGQAGEFAGWIREFGGHEAFLPASFADEFLRRAGGGALARVYAHFSRDWEMMHRWPLALVGEGTDDFARRLLFLLRAPVAYDFDDVMMLLWLIGERPWAGLPLTLELPVNLLRHPSPRLPEGQEELLDPVLGKALGFREALEEYRRSRRTREARAEEELIRSRDWRAGGDGRPVPVCDFLRVAHGRGGERAAAPGERAAGEPVPPGVNIHGPFKSPIGIGTAARGLHLALESAGFPCRRVVSGGVVMDEGTVPGDFMGGGDAAFGTNLFVSYPHLHEVILHTLPPHLVRGKRNVVHLSWEQREGNPRWAEVFAGFDQVWTLSGFTAQGLRASLGREVTVVPCVVDFDSLPGPVRKEEFGLDAERTVFLYVFDAASSMERKNPWGLVKAFSRAFAPSDPVSLVLKVANGRSPHFAEKLRGLREQIARSPLEIRLLEEPMSHGRVLRLISAADCYVSLHRAEGFGYTCAEAMAYGLPVIATGYSGNLDFMNGENSLLVEAAERAIEIYDGPFCRGSLWGEPDVDHAADLMRLVLEDPGSAEKLGERAARDVRARLSPEAVGGIVRRALTGSAIES